MIWGMKGEVRIRIILRRGGRDLKSGEESEGACDLHLGCLVV